MKIVYILLLILSFTNTLRAECIGSPSSHDNFCKNKNEDLCKLQSVCSWKENTIKIKVQAIKKKCVVKDQMHMHSHLCEDSDYTICKTHNNFCDWE